MVYEIARAAASSAGRYLNPLARIAWRRAALILAQNEDTVRSLPARYRGKVRVFPNVAVDIIPERRVLTGRRVALFAGRLLHWKGGSLAIRAIKELPYRSLVICGTGPDEYRLRRLARKFGVQDRVTFQGWIPRNELLDLDAERSERAIAP